MRNRKAFIVGFGFATILVASALVMSMSSELKPFDQAAFQQAKEHGKTVLLDFHADWCPICRMQSKVLPQVLKEPKFKDVVAFTVDYDTAKEIEKELKVSAQSTLVVFKGAKEVARGRGVTQPQAIRDLLAKGL